MKEIIAQAIGIVAAAVVILSFQQKKQRTVIICQMLGQLLFSVNYLLLGIPTGACLNFLGFARGIIYSNKEKFHAERPIWLILSIASFFCAYLAGFLFFGAEPTIANIAVNFMPVVAITLATISFRAKTAATVRRLGLLSSPLWLTYNIINFTLGGIICEIFNLISIIVGMIRLDIKKQQV
ncbi:MAG: YgjV family protein [Clostridia bacterium]|nr:YgjV family protein [Clostridia bacterium]